MAPLTAADRRLRFAAWNRSGEAIDSHLAMGADVNAANRFGFRPIHLCASAGNAETLKLLLRARADADVATEEREPYTFVYRRMYYCTGGKNYIRILLCIIHLQIVYVM